MALSRMISSMRHIWLCATFFRYATRDTMEQADLISTFTTNATAHAATTSEDACVMTRQPLRRNAAW